MHAVAKIVMTLAVATLAANFAVANNDNVLVIRGKVTGDDGKPADGAQIQVRALDRKAPPQIALTDSRGQYIVLGLVPGRYSVTASDPNGVARSRAIIKSDRRGWARVDFDLALDTMVGDGANTIKQVIVTSGHAFGSPR
jgi:hypothetical protein